MQPAVADETIFAATSGSANTLPLVAAKRNHQLYPSLRSCVCTASFHG